RISQMRREVLTVVLFGDASTAVLHRTGEDLRDFLLQSPDITQVDLEGVPPLEIGIEPSQDQLRRYGLTLGDIAAHLAASAVDIPAGGLKTDNGEILVRLTERREYGHQFAELPIIITENGTKILLRDIANINDSFADTDRSSRYNGQNAVMLDVYRVGNETPIQVADSVHRQIEAFESFMPLGIETAISNDRSDNYRQRVYLLLKNGAFGLILVLVLLGLFLEARLAFWVTLGIPISFIGSFLFLPIAGVTINMVSLFAYIVALGIVVDDAIVVGENIYYYRQKGLAPLAAAIRGTREVVTPVTFSILTNIAAFMPIYFIPGITGNIFRMIPIVVCIVFVISLVECIFVLPAHLGHESKRKRSAVSSWLHDRQQVFSKWFTWWVYHRYGPVLSLSLRHRYLTILVAMSILALTVAYAASGRMGFQMFPVIESNFSAASVMLPYGSPVAKTKAVVAKIEAGIQKVLEESGHPELITGITTDIGRGGGHIGRIRAELADPKIRHKIMGTEEFTQRWRKAVGEISGLENMRFSADSGGPGGGGRAITV
ncbi:MAG: efflux RND transporter permease subunit, partial [Candidatus Hydrogenedentes bacterium]|nr:efflux RND transporter permease subunit [Candidatus Hydrogenedentota bacterium]